MKVKVSPATALVVAFFLVSLLLSHFAFARVARVRYDGFQMWRAKPKTREQADAIYSLQQYGVELWREPIFARSGELDETSSADLFIAPASIPAIAATLDDADVKYEVVISDIQPVIDAEKEKMENNPSTRKHEFSFTDWQQYETIIHYLRDVAEYSGGRIQLVEMSEKSSEQKPLYVLKIRSEDSWQKPETKPVIFIEGGMHAREWISPAVAIYIASELANNVDGPEGALNRKLLERFDFHIFPLANPDGYKFTQMDRMWRKSRSRAATLLNWCPGVDLNRNFDIKWNETYGGSNFPCAQDYKGPAPLSEPETRAMSNYWKSLGDRFKAYFSFHSYGQIWAYPFGYKRDDPEDHLVLSEVVNHGAAKLGARHSTKYQLGSAAQLLYLVSGSTIDYVYDVMGVKHSYLLELRPTVGDGQGFLLDPKLILPTSIETWDGIREALDYVHKDLYGYKFSQDLQPSVGERTLNDEIAKEELAVAEVKPAERNSPAEDLAVEKKPVEDPTVQSNAVEKPVDNEASVGSQSESSEVTKDVESAEKAADQSSNEQKEESSGKDKAKKDPEPQLSEEAKDEEPKEVQKSEEVESSEKKETVSTDQSAEVPANDEASTEDEKVNVSGEVLGEEKATEGQKVSDEAKSQESSEAEKEKQASAEDVASKESAGAEEDKNSAEQVDPTSQENDKASPDVEEKKPSSDEAASQESDKVDDSNVSEEEKQVSSEKLEARQAVSDESKEDQAQDEASKENQSLEDTYLEDKSQEHATSDEPKSDEVKDEKSEEKVTIDDPTSDEAKEASKESSDVVAAEASSDEASKEFNLPYPALVLLRRLDQESNERDLTSEEQPSASDETSKVQELKDSDSHGYDSREASNEKPSSEVSSKTDGSDEAKASGEIPVNYLMKFGGIHD